MPFLQPRSISEAARELELSPARVRAMAASGQLPAEKIGGRWLIEQSAVQRRRQQGGIPGRRFTAANAWALLVLSSDGYFSPTDGLATADDVLAHVPPSVRSRLNRLLLSEGLEKLAPRLDARAKAFRYQAHPGEISHVENDPSLMATGITGAARYRLISGSEVDGYVSAADLPEFVERHVLTESPPDGNVCIRAVPEEVWRTFGGKSLAPMAAIALDLMEGRDSRSKEVGREWLRALDNGHRRDAKRRQ